MWAVNQLRIVHQQTVRVPLLSRGPLLRGPYSHPWLKQWSQFKTFCHGEHKMLLHTSRQSCKIKCTPQRGAPVVRQRGGVITLSLCGLIIAPVGLLRSAQCLQMKTRHRKAEMTHSQQHEPKFNWKELMKMLLPQLLSLIVAVISAFAVAIVNIKIPMLLGELVDVVSQFTTDNNPSQYLSDMIAPALRLLSAYGFQGVLTFVYIYLLSHVGESVASTMRLKLFSSLINQDISFFDSHRTGELINRLTADVQDFKSSFKLVVSQGLKSITQTVGCVAALYTISPKLATILVVVVPIVIGAGTMMGSMLRKLSRKTQEQVARATSVADEALGNIRTVRAFAMERKESDLYNAELQLSTSLNEKLGLGIALFQGLSNFILNNITLLVLYTGGTLIAYNELSPGDLMSFLVATQTIQRSLQSVSVLFGQAVRGWSAGSRVFEYMSLEPMIPTEGGNIIPYHSLMGNVKFNNVTFSYPSRPQQTILNNLTLSVPTGKVVALCGLSGGGKSTIATLLERFYDVDSGSVTLDGVDIRTLDPSWLRGRVIGFINQEPVLFATSVMENIRYGNPSATDQQVYEAAIQANADEFIRSFPDGYKTVLGERGVTVSGGQKQRIAIARALVKNPDILILDEATSALDAESERVVQQALDRLCKGRTVLVVAHRLSTIQNADIIAVISGGQVKEIGTHKELVKNNGLYSLLIKRQTMAGSDHIDH